jgi:hypothetical protein
MAATSWSQPPDTADRLRRSAVRSGGRVCAWWDASCPPRPPRVGRPAGGSGLHGGKGNPDLGPSVWRRPAGSRQCANCWRRCAVAPEAAGEFCGHAERRGPRVEPAPQRSLWGEGGTWQTFGTALAACEWHCHQSSSARVVLSCAARKGTTSGREPDVDLVRVWRLTAAQSRRAETIVWPDQEI